MRSLKENFAKFFEKPSREGLREILKNNVGEQDNLEFKEDYPVYSKLSKHMLAIANSGGGCIIIGVAESGDELNPVGIESFFDKADIDKGLRRYLPNELKYEVLDFHFKDSEYNSIKGKKYQVIFIDYDPGLIPFVSLNDGEGIKKNAIYIRRGTNSEEVDYHGLQSLLNNRIETQYSSRSEIELKEHIEQLKILYSNIDKYHYVYKDGNRFAPFGQLVRNIFGEHEMILNQHYPEEDFEAFIVRMIEKKKKKIESVLEIR